MLKTDICNPFGIEYPIIQGGMAHLATAELASVVSNAGGLGLIASANYPSHWLHKQIKLAHNLTSRSFCANLYLPSHFLKEQISVILEEQIPMVVSGEGDLDEGLIMIGKSVGLIKEAKSAKDIIKGVMAHFKKILTQFTN